MDTRDRQDPLTDIAVENARIFSEGGYSLPDGTRVDITDALSRARKRSKNFKPDAILIRTATPLYETSITVTNESTLEAATRLTTPEARCLALNFANGLVPGGGYLYGARAQEESLCRATALYEVIRQSPMYAYHQEDPARDSSDWAIVSPEVPVFRDGHHELLARPYTLDFITCAAPDKEYSGARSEELLDRRILRLLRVARCAGHECLVLGAWGCGAFGNDPALVAASFRRHLEGECRGLFRHITFAILDSTRDQRTSGPFRKEFA